MSTADGIDGLGRELLRALRAEPLDVPQLAVDLGVIPVAVTTEVDALMERGLVHGVTVERGRQAWGLTIKDRSGLAGEKR
jgi:predicted ArsR family transcriptional regulator